MRSVATFFQEKIAPFLATKRAILEIEEKLIFNAYLLTEEGKIRKNAFYLSSLVNRLDLS